MSKPIFEYRPAAWWQRAAIMRDGEPVLLLDRAGHNASYTLTPDEAETLSMRIVSLLNHFQTDHR